MVEPARAASKIWLVLADVDGTLVNADKLLTPRAGAAVKALHAAGIAFAITSGRPPAAKPILGLARRPGRQLDVMAVIAAHPRAMHYNLAAVEADLALGHAHRWPTRPPPRRWGAPASCYASPHTALSLQCRPSDRSARTGVHILPTQFEE